MPLSPLRRVPRPPDARHVRPRRHVGPQLLRPLLLQHALEQRRAVRDHRARPVPEPRRDRRVHHRVDRRRSSTPSARRASSAATAWTRRSARSASRSIEGLQHAAHRAATDNEWGVAGRPHVHRHGRGARGAAHVQPPVRPRASRTSPATRRSACWEGTLDRRRAALRRHARPLEGRARPLVGRPPGRRARGAGHPGPPGARTATGSATTGCPMQFDDHMLKIQIDQDADGHRHRRGVDAGAGTSTSDRPIEHLGTPEVDIDVPSPAHARSRRRSITHHGSRGQADRGHDHAAAHAVPRRRLGLRPRRRVGPRLLPGTAEGGGHRARPQRPRGAAPLRDPQRDAVPLRD